MQIKSTDQGYGMLARLLHWSMAITILAMFGLGVWMRSLSYYSTWYHRAPDIHKSIGIILLLALCLRLLWRLLDHHPDDSYLKPRERKISSMVHHGFYLLLAALMGAGYLIATLDGHAISVFGWADVPSLFQKKGLEDWAGLVHQWLAYGLMALVVLHASAALKHHFVDRDKTLLRMIRSTPKQPTVT